ncbi:MAG: LysR family transcriptional regulator [Marmoricola sp.]|nr:LysR family transcriptional regulator [Marmoricola sp.]
MRIEQLQYVAAVTQYGSLRRASEHMHLSQPALSESLTKLEKELGVVLLDRRRSGTTISAAGRDLMQNIVDVLDAAERLRAAAGDQLAALRVVRIGTVNAGTSTLLLPVLEAFQVDFPGVSVEIRTLQTDQIHQDLLDGALDLGIINLLDGDDVAPELAAIELLRGSPVAVLPTGHPLAEQEQVTVEELRAERFVAMRSGYLMHRFAHRLFGTELPAEWHSTDGAEMGKVMVADGLGITVLPDYSVLGDPLERAGLITTRPIAGDRTVVRLSLQHRRQRVVSEAVKGLVAGFRRQAAVLSVPEGPLRSTR